MIEVPPVTDGRPARGPGVRDDHRGTPRIADRGSRRASAFGTRKRLPGRGAWLTGAAMALLGGPAAAEVALSELFDVCAAVVESRDAAPADPYGLSPLGEDELHARAETELGPVSLRIASFDGALFSCSVLGYDPRDSQADMTPDVTWRAAADTAARWAAARADETGHVDLVEEAGREAAGQAMLLRCEDDVVTSGLGAGPLPAMGDEAPEDPALHFMAYVEPGDTPCPVADEAEKTEAG